MTKKVYRAVSLFSGCGGLDLGFLKTGRVNVVFANDFNSAACDTYRMNIGDHIYCGDVSKIQELPEAEILMGGPPCQGFSTANPNRAFEDPRNFLYREYVRILNIVKPVIFVMENVSGMVTMEGGRVLRIIKGELQKSGYHVQHKIINAKNFGTPQNRRRVIIVGTRLDIQSRYQYPCEYISPPLFGEFKTVGDALLAKEISHGDPNHKVSNLSDLNLERIRYIPQGGSMKDVPVELRNNSDLKRAMRRLDIAEVSPTIVHNNSDHYYHPIENRRITIREMARLQDYPDSFIFLGSKSEQSRQLGNSVPINLAQAIGQSFVEFLDSATI